MYIECSQNAMEYLKSRDKALGLAIDKIGEIHRKKDSDLFSSVINHIIGQQISMKAQETIWNRLHEKLGEINADTLLSITKDELQRVGLTFRKAEYIRDFASKVKSNEFDIEKIKVLEDEMLIKELVKLKGIGVWTAEMIMLFCLDRKDILSYDDLAIKRGLKMLYNHKDIDKKKFNKYKKRYSPYGTVASLYLWAIAGGAMKNKFAIYTTKFGNMKIEYENDAILSIQKTDESKKLGEKTDLTDDVYRQLCEYFDGNRIFFDFKYEMRGTEFQKKVWNALTQIPYGETRSYKDIAIAIGNEKASRAVGMANNKNPMAIVVPCHRVIGKNGKLVGYAGGIDMKRELLELESKNI